MPDITCIGILCADVLGKPVEEIPEKGKLKLVDTISIQLGGCAANVTVALSKIGLRSRIIGKIGSDNLGKFVLQALKSEKVSIDGLTVDSDSSTSASIVVISKDGERSILHSLGANATFDFDDINLDIVKNTKFLLIAGTFLMPKFDGDGAAKLLKVAKHHNVICCMDTAWDSEGKWTNKIEKCFKYLDWFMPSYDEAYQMSGKSNPEEIANHFILKGVKNVIIKLDKEGCYVKPEKQAGFYTPSFSQVKSVDASGAGDSFCAGFITGLSLNWSISKCAQFANAVGAHCIMEIGTTKGIKSKEEILKFISNYPKGCLETACTTST